jgi:hypothetical protein
MKRHGEARHTAGQEISLADFDADAAEGQGTFEGLHGTRCPLKDWLAIPSIDAV